MCIFCISEYRHVLAMINFENLLRIIIDNNKQNFARFSKTMVQLLSNIKKKYDSNNARSSDPLELVSLP